MRMRNLESWAACGRNAAFTLIELVLVMTILVTVLAVSYRVIVDCLQTDRNVENITLPDKIGEGLLLVFRRDVSGTYFRHYGRDVFQVTDGGTPPDARDELRFLTTVDPTPIEESDGGTNTVYEVRAMTGVHYFLMESEHVRGVRAYTLYRKEMVELDPEMPLESPGIAYELYDKVAYLSVECFDGELWDTAWDSRSRIELEEEEMALLAEERQGRIGRVSDAQAGSSTAVANAPGVAPEQESVSLPPAAVPVAVRIEIGVYLGRGSEIEITPGGEPVLKTFSATIPLIAAQRFAMQLDDTVEGELGPGGAGAGGDDLSAFEGTTRTGRTSSNPTGGGRGGGRSGGRGFTAGGRADGARGGGRGGGPAPSGRR